MDIESLVGIGVIVAALVLLFASTFRKRRDAGQHPGTIACTQCGKPQPVLRMPRSGRQVLEGGWTCSGCGTELDRYGAPVAKS